MPQMLHVLYELDFWTDWREDQRTWHLPSPLHGTTLVKLQIDGTDQDDDTFKFQRGSIRLLDPKVIITEPTAAVARLALNRSSAKRFRIWMSIALASVIVAIVFIYLRSVAEPEPVAQPQANGGRMSLQDCYGDAIKRLNATPVDQPVVIKQLGLDMAEAGVEFSSFVAKINNRKIEIQLLVMTDNENELGPDPPSPVLVWSRSAGDYIKLGFPRLQRSLKEKRPQSHIDLRTYKGLPGPHGFRVSGGSCDIVYMSFCRYKEPEFNEFDWGQHRYHAIPADTTTSERNLVDVFMGMFNHHWQVGASRGKP